MMICLPTLIFATICTIALTAIFAASQPTPNLKPLWGVNYGPRRNTPPTACPSLASIQADIALLSNLTARVKTFHLIDPDTAPGVTCRTAEAVLTAVAESGASGLRVWLGMALDGSEARFESELRELVRLARTGPAMFGAVEAVIVGSETLFRGELTVPRLTAYLARTHIGGPTYAEPLIDAVDVVMINLYPFWESFNVKDASAYQERIWREIGARSKGKTVVLGEIGWPTAGETMGAAVPSLGNLRFLLAEWRCKAAQKQIPYFWFEFTDESWKPNFHSVERHWGLFDERRITKVGQDPLRPC
ncbi:glycoside hydrolase superfamily [Zopfochytrium polystomum]|nr:glycoside hydrolase superfamily [Zopfochytrium polystomum]